MLFLSNDAVYQLFSIQEMGVSIHKNIGDKLRKG